MLAHYSGDVTVGISSYSHYARTARFTPHRTARGTPPVLFSTTFFIGRFVFSIASDVVLWRAHLLLCYSL